MATTPLLSFRREVTLVQSSTERVRLEFPWGQATLNQLTPGLLAALRMLSAGGTTEENLSDLVLETDGASALAPMYYQLQKFSNLRLLCYTVPSDGLPLATMVPIAGSFPLHLELVGADTPFRLSRFAVCRREGDTLVLESPLSLARTVLHKSTSAALVAELALPRTYVDLCAGAGLTEDAAQAFLSLLANAALVAPVAEDGTLAEDANPTLAQWEFHDLLFHCRSRVGRHDATFGASFRFLDKILPLPALKPKMSDSVIPLYKPDLKRLGRDDLPLTRVLEQRRSVRDYGDRPITAEQLGEFLYRVARVRQIVERDPACGLLYEASNRPYPSGGATYDLEFYVTVGTCTGIASGLYHYDPLDHQLCKVAERDTHVEALLNYARLSAGLASEPQVLITLASRFQRVSWKYSSMAYATTLKNVGVLYQTMYLVATAMGLAPCGLGGGDSALFADAVGTDYFAESSVGEFLLGTAGSTGA
jgi:SagB-type dehydrogenase family enzyme